MALLNVEMEKYDPRLVKKPTILAINKIDLLNGFEVSNFNFICFIITILHMQVFPSNLSKREVL